MGGGDMYGEGAQTGGVKPMSIAGRMVRERERLQGMTAEERAWRKKWLKDQVLSPNEPKYIVQLEKEFYNPIRRAYRAPMTFLFHTVLEPVIGHDWAKISRFYICRGSLILASAYGFYYLFKYNHNNWESKNGWRVISAKKAIFPGEPGYGEPLKPRPPNDYFDRGFKASVLNKWK